MSQFLKRGSAGGALLFSLLCLGPRSAAGQSTLERPPNLSGGWVGSSGILHFNFVHRFTASDPPSRKVVNTPTLLVAASLPRSLLAGFNYATNSDLVPGMPNEWEFFGRVTPLRQERGALVDAGLELAYNQTAESLDAELTFARRVGRARFVVVGRAFSNGFGENRARTAVGGGTTLRLRKWIALGGDVVVPLEREADEKAAWSAGLQLAIPYTPHTLSLHAANSRTSTLQSSSRGRGKVTYGFEFTIPVTLRRYFPARRPAAAAPADTAPSAPGAAAEDQWPAASAPLQDGGSEAALAPERLAPATEAGIPAPTGPTRRVEIRQFSYTPGRVVAHEGETVTWANADPVAHTVTARDRSFDSGEFASGKSWSHTFRQPGIYEFFCTPHPFMKGVVVVLAASGWSGR